MIVSNQTHNAEPAQQPSSPSSSGPNTWWILFVVTLLVIVVDQVSKRLVAANLDRGESWMPLDAVYPLFRLTHVHNTGAAFGLFPDGGAVFLIIAVAVSAIILVFYHQLPRGAWLLRVALGLQLGGALGNVIDRVRQGYVTDFFHVDFWPVFNVADSAIVVGVVLMAVNLLWEDWQAARAERGAASIAENDALPHDTSHESAEEQRFSSS